jgi:hypothetical protein
MHEERRKMKTRVNRLMNDDDLNMTTEEKKSA